MGKIDPNTLPPKTKKKLNTVAEIHADFIKTYDFFSQIESLIQWLDYEQIPERAPVQIETRREQLRDLKKHKFIRSLSRSKSGSLDEILRKIYELLDDEASNDNAFQPFTDPPTSSKLDVLVEKIDESLLKELYSEYELLSEQEKRLDVLSIQTPKGRRQALKTGNKLSSLKAMNVFYNICAENIKTRASFRHKANVLIFYGEQMNVHRLDWQTREAFNKGVARTTRQRIRHYLHQVLKHGFTSNIQLTSFQLTIMLLLYEMNLIQISRLGQNFFKYGVFTTAVARTIIILCIEMPFVMKIMAMASGSRTYLIHFFRSLPLLKGIGYCSMVLCIMMQTEICMLFEGTGKILVYMFTKERNLLECVQREVHDFECIPYENDRDHFDPNCTSNDGKKYTFATQYFTSFIMLDNFREMNFMMHGAGIIIWILALLISLNGINIIKKTASRMTVAASIPSLLIFLYMAIARIRHIILGIPVYSFFRINWDVVLTARFFLDTMNLGAKIYQLPFLIWISSMKPDTHSCQYFVVKSMCLTIVGTWLFSFIYLISVWNIREVYRFSPGCLYLRSFDHIFTIIPDLAQGFFASTLWILLYLISTLYVELIFLVYTVNCTTDTLVEALPQLRRYALLMILGVWLLNLALRYIRSADTIETIEEPLDMDRLEIINGLFFGFLAIGIEFFYGTQRFNDDYIFYTGVKPNRFWHVTSHIVVFSAFLSIICAVIQICKVLGIINKYANDDNTEYIVEIATTFIAITVVVFFYLKHTCMWIYRKNASESFKPEPSWGCHDTKLSKIRRFYFSSRDVRAVHQDADCSHHCILHNKAYALAAKEQLILLPINEKSVNDADIIEDISDSYDEESQVSTGPKVIKSTKRKRSKVKHNVVMVNEKSKSHKPKKFQWLKLREINKMFK